MDRGLSDHVENELPKLRAEWEAGSASALIKAFVWCAGNDQPFPQWLLESIFDELRWAREHRPRGGTKTSGNSLAWETNELKQGVRFRLMELFLDDQREEIKEGRRSEISEIAAARGVKKFLEGRGHPAGEGSAEQIRRSWKSLKKG